MAHGLVVDKVVVDVYYTPCVTLRDEKETFLDFAYESLLFLGLLLSSPTAVVGIEFVKGNREPPL